MRIAIVKLSTVAKYDRLDPGFYLGDPSLVEDLRRARVRLRQAVAAVRRTRKAVEENEAKVREMRDAGEVIDVK